MFLLTYGIMAAGRFEFRRSELVAQSAVEVCAREGVSHRDQLDGEALEAWASRHRLVVEPGHRVVEPRRSALRGRQALKRGRVVRFADRVDVVSIPAATTFPGACGPANPGLPVCFVEGAKPFLPLRGFGTSPHLRATLRRGGALRP